MSTQQDAPWGAHQLRGWKNLWLHLCHAIPPWPGLRRLALWVRKPLKTQLKNWTDAEVWGLRLRLFPKGNLSEQRVLLMPQFFDPAERAALADVLAQGGTFFDIGANIGAYSLWTSSVSDSVRIEAFEPDQELCDRLRFNLETNALTSRVHINNLALGRQAGTMQLVQDEANRGQNQVLEASNESQHTVQVETLHSFQTNQGIQDLAALKIDIEGGEVDVMEPYFDQMPRAQWPRLVICEVGREYKTADELPIWKLLEGAGYQLETRTRMNGIFRLQG